MLSLDRPSQGPRRGAGAQLLCRRLGPSRHSPPRPGWGSGRRSQRGRIPSLPPAHTKTTRSDQGACGRAPRGCGAHTHTHALREGQGPGVRDQGTGSRRQSGRTYRRAAAAARAGALAKRCPDRGRVPGARRLMARGGLGSLRSGTGGGGCGCSSFLGSQPRRLVRSWRFRRGPCAALWDAESRALRAQPRAARAPRPLPSRPTPVRRAPPGPAPAQSPAPYWPFAAPAPPSSPVRGRALAALVAGSRFFPAVAGKRLSVLGAREVMNLARARSLCRGAGPSPRSHARWRLWDPSLVVPGARGQGYIGSGRPQSASQ